MDLAFFGPSAVFHHVGMAVQEAAQAGLPDLAMTVDPVQGVRVGFVSLGGCCIELIEPLGPESPVSNSLSRGIKLLHLCYEVDDVEEALRLAEQHRFKIIHTPTPAVAFEGRAIAWVWHPVWGVFELLERARDT